MSGDDRAAVRADRIEALLEAILGQLRLLTAAHGPRDECERALEAAIAEEFSPSPFTLRMLLEVEKGDPAGPLARALAEMVDTSLKDRARATALGARLAKMPWIKRQGEQRGSALYRRVADLADAGPQ